MKGEGGERPTVARSGENRRNDLEGAGRAKAGLWEKVLPSRAATFFSLPATRRQLLIRYQVPPPRIFIYKFWKLSLFPPPPFSIFPPCRLSAASLPPPCHPPRPFLRISLFLPPQRPASTHRLPAPQPMAPPPLAKQRKEGEGAKKIPTVGKPGGNSRNVRTAGQRPSP